MKNAITIAKLTFLQAIRMKVAIAFITLLAICLIAMPSLMTGDGTLAGQIRSTLFYSFSAVTMLLSLLTLLIGAMLVSEDIRRRQIFLIAVKPVSRTDYLLGRFLGVMALNVVLITISAVAIYSMVASRRSEPTSTADRIAIETEVFTARDRLSPMPPNLDKRVGQRVAYLKEKGQYNKELENYRRHNKILGGESPEEKFLRSLYILERKQAELIQPHSMAVWNFEGVYPAGQTQTGTATLLAGNDTIRRYHFKADPDIVGRMQFGAPIRFGSQIKKDIGVKGGFSKHIEGQIVHIIHGEFFIELSKRTPLPQEFLVLQKQKTIQFQIDPVMQLRYTAKPTSDLPAGHETLPRILSIGPPEQKPTVQTPPSQTAVHSAVTQTFSAVDVAKDGKTQVVYWYGPIPQGARQPFPTIELAYEDVSLLYRADDFTPNYIRCWLLVLARLTFLTALALMLSSILDFPVAILTSMTLLLGSLLVGWLLSQQWGDPVPAKSFIDYLNVAIHYIMVVLMPDIGGVSAAENISDGMNVSWGVLGNTYALTVLLRSGLYLSLGCWLFTRRELADPRS